MIEDYEPVLVLTREDARTILWADETDKELRQDQGELGIHGVVEWDMLVDKARKVQALDVILDRDRTSF